MRSKLATGVAAATLVATLGLAALAGASSSASPAKAQLTGTYRVTFHFVSPAASRKTRTTLTLGFTPACTSGACDVRVSTLANSCVSGSCGQPPSAFAFATELLRLTGGEYKGTFTIKTSCTRGGNYWPYAYEQRTLLSIRPTAAQDLGDSPQVMKFVGTAELVGSPDATGKKWGCVAYRYGIDVAGTSNS